MNISQLIEKYGPAVVAAAQRQVLVAIGQDWVWAWAGVAIVVLGIALIVGGLMFGDYDASGFALFGILVMIPGLVIAALAFGEINTYTQNPDWAVIQLITKSIK